MCCTILYYTSYTTLIISSFRPATYVYPSLPSLPPSVPPLTPPLPRSLPPPPPPPPATSPFPPSPSHSQPQPSNLRISTTAHTHIPISPHTDPPSLPHFTLPPCRISDIRKTLNSYPSPTYHIPHPRAGTPPTLSYLPRVRTRVRTSGFHSL